MKGGDNSPEKLHPKLRMISNGSDEVNALRAELSSTVVSTRKLKVEPPPKVRECLQKPNILRAPGNESAFALDVPRKKRRKLKVEGEAKNGFVNVLLELKRDRTGDSTDERVEGMQALQGKLRKWLKKEGHEIDGCVLSKRNFISATVSIRHLEQLRKDKNVAFIHPAEALSFKLPVAASDNSSKPAPKKFGLGVRHQSGAKTLIGIIDVGGFDFAHPDFLADGKTRFCSIWDQRGVFRDPPKKFGYGSVIGEREMNAALAEQKKGGLPATRLEPQSQMVVGSHGTHVASIAAGASGVCPKARIAGVVIDIPRQGDQLTERRLTFSDSTRILHAVEYLLDLAKELDLSLSINISLGTNGGAHDGSSSVSRWFDAILATEGCSICVAAGNAGQDSSSGDGDLGWILGHIHSSSQIAAQGLDVDLEWAVVGNSITDISENEMEIWYPAQDRVTVELIPPESSVGIRVRPREFVENRQLESGTFVSIYNELYHPANGANYIAIYLSPQLDPSKPIGVKAGVWKVRLHGEEIRDGRYHAWIERDDPYEMDRNGQVRVFRFPSFFSDRSNVDSHSINSLACGARVIAVANLDEGRQLINSTSSQGPTRDGRCKPDIAAPGTAIVAARGFATAGELWTAMSGTSMASPYVAGVIGLMLSANPELTAAQCIGILQRSARPLPGASYEWQSDAGYGQIDPDKALAEAVSFDVRTPIRNEDL